MKRYFVIGITMLAMGFATGYYWGYSRPLSCYARNFKTITGMSDQNLAEFAKTTEKMVADVGRQESYVAAINLMVLTKLEAGQTDAAKQFLAKNIAGYYLVYSKLQHPSADRETMLAKIKLAEEHSPALKTALAEKIE